VTPGATIALGLMYLKTNNVTIATRLEIPDTQFLLDFIRPDCLMLRMLSRCLVMWDSIEPTVSWVETNCPPIVLRHQVDSQVGSVVYFPAFPKKPRFLIVLDGSDFILSEKG